MFRLKIIESKSNLRNQIKKHLEWSSSLYLRLTNSYIITIFNSYHFLYFFLEIFLYKLFFRMGYSDHSLVHLVQLAAIRLRCTSYYCTCLRWLGQFKYIISMTHNPDLIWKRFWVSKIDSFGPEVHNPVKFINITSRVDEL